MQFAAPACSYDRGSKRPTDGECGYIGRNCRGSPSFELGCSHRFCESCLVEYWVEHVGRMKQRFVCGQRKQSKASAAAPVVMGSGVCDFTLSNLFDFVLSSPANAKAVHSAYESQVYRLEFVVLCPRVTDEKTGTRCERPTLKRATAPRIVGCATCRVGFCVWCNATAVKWACPNASTTCTEDPLLRELRDCRTKQIDKIADVPSTRACPGCGHLVVHADKCKHMKCTVCELEFCFACLSIKDPIKGWSCGKYNDPCPVAPRQTSIPYREPDLEPLPSAGSYVPPAIVEPNKYGSAAAAAPVPPPPAEETGAVQQQFPPPPTSYGNPQNVQPPPYVPPSAPAPQPMQSPSVPTTGGGVGYTASNLYNHQYAADDIPILPPPVQPGMTRNDYPARPLPGDGNTNGRPLSAAQIMSSGFCGCFDDCETLFLGCCCPPCAFAAYNERIGNGSFQQNLCGYICSCARPCHAGAARGRFLNMLGLPNPGACALCTLHMFCWCLAFAQEGRAAKAYAEGNVGRLLDDGYSHM